MAQQVAPGIEQAFRRAREELGIRSGFPAEVVAEAERVARERAGRAAEGRVDQTEVPFVTVDPPGSRDLDQAVHAERAAEGYHLRYAIADVGYWVDRGSVIEQEAWLRGVTYYAPDCRDPLYPPVLSQGAASLLPNQAAPAFVFDFQLDGRAQVVRWSLERAVVRSIAQLTYADLQAQRAGGWGETLSLIREIGLKLLDRERERGGVSLPVREQHVVRTAASRLGYTLEYEEPSEAEQWNAEISLLTGHVAGELMLERGVGLLRTMPPFSEKEVAKFRRIALTLGFEWAEGTSYSEFMHRLDPKHPRIEPLVRQARRVMHGAEYVAFDGTPPEQPLHGALNFVYAHSTAPLRRLADRYVLDLLVTLSTGNRPSAQEVAALQKLPPVMQDAARREGQLERRIVDIAEAWALRDCIGQLLTGTVIDVERDGVEVQVDEPAIRTVVDWRPESLPELGRQLRLEVAGVDLERGKVQLTVAAPAS